MEVDLVFPRNETYALNSTFPVVFAIKNPELASLLSPQFSFTINQWDNWNGTSIPTYSSKYDVRWKNYSSDPLFVYSTFPGLDIEAVWWLTWSVSWGNCTEERYKLKTSYDEYSTSLTFTTSSSGQAIDLVAGTESDDCPAKSGVALEVASALDVSVGVNWEGFSDKCPVLADTTPMATPCEVKIDAATEASMAASLASDVCLGTQVVGCGDDDESAGGRLAVGGVALSAAVLVTLGFVLHRSTRHGVLFNMAEAGFLDPKFLYTGSRTSSDATKGVCTGTAGYIADAEIAEIMEDSSRVVKSFVDSTSNSDIPVYNDTQWVGYMNWASDWKEYHDVPSPATSWAISKEKVVSGEERLTYLPKNDNWTAFDCTDEYNINLLDYTPSERWKGPDFDAAWDDVVGIWLETGRLRDGTKFIESVSSTLKIGASPKCEKLSCSNCKKAVMCGTGQDGEYSSPAAQLIWNSLIIVHQLHKDYHDELIKVATVVSTMFDDLENKFAPVPEEEDNA
ncbi:hypothetical protein E8E14_009945 [Neopestalotiopsis sp. 37M]|nr:hypothetical protein E8E14_009945 [Neopestalotiopsis sp. 37M]